MPFRLFRSLYFRTSILTFNVFTSQCGKHVYVLILREYARSPFLCPSSFWHYFPALLCHVIFNVFDGPITSPPGDHLWRRDRLRGYCSWNIWQFFEFLAGFPSTSHFDCHVTVPSRKPISKAERPLFANFAHLSRAIHAVSRCTPSYYSLCIHIYGWKWRSS